jgi:site-specific DNA-methyltransferase (adenine-specific)
MPSYHLAQTDANFFLQSLPAGSVSLIITDPAYESLEKHRKIGTTTRLKESKASSNEWFTIFTNDRFPRFFRECFRVLAKNSHLYMFCDDETMFITKPIAESVGFKFWKKLVWDYKHIGMGYHWRSRHQNIMFFEKGKRKLHDLSEPDVIAGDECTRIRNGYPTEKPVGVSTRLVVNSSNVGDLVVDPFMGSGSVGVAAVQQGRDFFGNDINEQAVQLAASRLVAAGGTAIAASMGTE